ncbi:TonB-dependent receptor domain-containing protein [Steroidobacter flavus]|uniref:TonB-dependent receptor domain-containing protein n=1 Tax=Steroidobacter flavus TaxID=1842136 RepID=A0ABV8SJX0_9GAMM
MSPVVMVLSGVACGLAAAVAPMPAFAEPVRVELAAQKMTDALNALAEQLKLQLIYDGKLVADLQGRALSGTMEPAAALRALLEGSGLNFRFVNKTTVTIERARETKGARTLGPVRVEGAERVQPKIGEGIATLGGVRGHQEDESNGYRALVATVGSGRPIPIEDTPRSVSVLTADLMRDQDVNDLGEALDRMPGVSVSSRIFSRGQTLEAVQVDGGPAYNINSFLRQQMQYGPEFANAFNMAAYERIELLHGVNAAAVGDGSYGGTLNLVRKRPSAQPAETLTLTAGSWNRWESTYDVTVPNIAGSNIAFRGVANWQTSEAFYDKYSRDNRALYGILDIPLSETSRAEFGVNYSKSAIDSPYQMVFRYADGPLLNVPRSTNFGPKWGYADSKDAELFTRIKTDFSDDWTLNVGVSRKSLEKTTSYMGDILNVTFRSDGTTTGFETPRDDLLTFDTETEWLTGDVSLAGKFQLWGLDHNLLLRGSYFDIDSADISNGWRNRRANDIIDSIEDFYLDDVRIVPYRRGQSVGSTRSITGSIEDLIAWRDKIDLRLAVGYSRAKNFSFSSPFLWENYYPDGTGRLMPSSVSYGNSKANLTPSYSVVFKPWRGWSIAPSYAEGTSAQSFYFTPSGEPLSAMKYKNKELMVRYSSGRWVASSSYYTADNDNVAQPMTGSNTCGPTHSSTCYFIGGSDVESKGYDVELTGTFFEQLSALASYNFNETTNIAANLPLNTQSPARTAKLFLNWAPPALPRWRFNAGYSYRSDVYTRSGNYVFDNGQIVGYVPVDFVTAGYHLFSAGASFDYSPALKFSLLVENLTDESYLSTANNYGGYYGEPRSVSLSFRWSDPSIARWGGGASVSDHFPFGDPSQWYTSLDFGYRTSPTIAARSPKRNDDGSATQWDWQLGSNFATFWRVGRHLNDRWRVEFEGGYRPIDIESTYTPGPVTGGMCKVSDGAPSFPDCDPSSGKFDTYSGMFNGIYEPWPMGGISPFVGLGLGLAVTQVEIGGRIPVQPANGGSRYLAGTDSHAVGAAMQGLAGLAIRLTDRLQADVSYRYFYVPDRKWDMDSNGRTNLGTEQYGLENFKGDLEDQSVTLSLRWNFDAGSTK